jgi:hypothetical protein
LPHQQIAASEHHRCRLLLLCFYRHEPHARTLSRLADRFGIGGIVLLALHERLDVSRRDQPHLVAKLDQLPRAPPHASSTKRQGGCEAKNGNSLARLIFFLSTAWPDASTQCA